ncbi:MAG: ABC transporter ATP-binding protein [Planctomycetes bacterium]|nr:ABC transporter ATP-binding protein [Planctomycetota bacterium]
MNAGAFLCCLREVRKTYRMGPTVIRALDGVTLTVRRGEYLAITGASGSGKSTMLHVMGLLDRPDSGSVFYMDQEVRRLSDRALSAVRNREIGFIFQSFNLLWEQTALHNVMLPLVYARARDPKGRTSRARAREALDRVGLADRLRHRPSELSGGQQQRVAIARALVKEPSLILADEPTGNLDSASGADVMAIFDDLVRQGITVAIITHDTAVASHARRRIGLRDGRVIADVEG